MTRSASIHPTGTPGWVHDRPDMEQVVVDLDTRFDSRQVRRAFESPDPAEPLLALFEGWVPRLLHEPANGIGTHIGPFQPGLDLLHVYVFAMDGAAVAVPLETLLEVQIKDGNFHWRPWKALPAGRRISMVEEALHQESVMGDDMPDLLDRLVDLARATRRLPAPPALYGAMVPLVLDVLVEDLPPEERAAYRTLQGLGAFT